MSASERHLVSRGPKSFQSTPLKLEQLEARMLMTINAAEEAIGLIHLLGSSYNSAEVQEAPAAPDVQGGAATGVGDIEAPNLEALQSKGAKRLLPNQRPRPSPNPSQRPSPHRNPLPSLHLRRNQRPFQSMLLPLSLRPSRSRAAIRSMATQLPSVCSAETIRVSRC